MEKGAGTQVELSGLPELRGRNRERSGKLELAGLLFFFFFFNFLIDFIFFKFYFIFKLYNIVLVLPNIEMNPPQVYMCSPILDC